MRISVITILAAMLIGACGSDDDGDVAVPVTPPPAPVLPTPTTVTFTQVYTTVLQPRCLSCHVPGGTGVTQGQLDMSTQALAYANLVGVPAAGSACAGQANRVVAGQSNTSLLSLKVGTAPPPCGDRMPQAAASLSGAEQERIAAWINAGAKND